MFNIYIYIGPHIKLVSVLRKSQTAREGAMFVENSKNFHSLSSGKLSPCFDLRAGKRILHF